MWKTQAYNYDNSSEPSNIPSWNNAFAKCNLSQYCHGFRGHNLPPSFARRISRWFLPRHADTTQLQSLLQYKHLWILVIELTTISLSFILRNCQSQQPWQSLNITCIIMQENLMIYGFNTLQCFLYIVLLVLHSNQLLMILLHNSGFLKQGIVFFFLRGTQGIIVALAISVKLPQLHTPVTPLPATTTRIANVDFLSGFIHNKIRHWWAEIKCFRIWSWPIWWERWQRKISNGLFLQ